MKNLHFENGAKRDSVLISVAPTLVIFISLTPRLFGFFCQWTLD